MGVGGSLWKNISQKQTVTIQLFQTLGRPFMPQVTCCTGVLVYAEMKLLDRKLRTVTIGDKTISGKNIDLGSPIMCLLGSSDSTNTYKTWQYHSSPNPPAVSYFMQKKSQVLTAVYRVFRDLAPCYFSDPSPSRRPYLPYCGHTGLPSVSQPSCTSLCFRSDGLQYTFSNSCMDYSFPSLRFLIKC